MKRLLLGAALMVAVVSGASASTMIYNVNFTNATKVKYRGQYNLSPLGFNIATTADATEPEFRAWCANLFSPYRNGTSYEDGTDALAAYKYDRLNSLVNAAYGRVDFGDADQVAGFQVAVWESVHERASNPLNVLGNGFYFTNMKSDSPGLDAPLSLAISYLQAAMNWDGVERYNWRFFANPNSQDLLAVTGAVSEVPLPASGLLAFGGVAAFGALARRRLRRRAGDPLRA